jgi:AcrR family transcriptional regulator
VTDPRIRRTRLHVLEIARQMLAARTSEPFTFTTLAAQAQVSRRTLYTHWGSIEKVISDAVTLRAAEELVDLSSLPPRERLRRFLESVRSGIGDPVTRVALASLMNLSSHDTDAAQSLVEMAATRMDHFRTAVGEIDETVYLQLVGPIFFAEFLGTGPASGELIDALVERGVELLGFE